MTDLERLQGTWQAVSVEEDGRTSPAEQTERTRVTIYDDNYALHVKDRVFHGFIGEIDPGKAPQAIDFIRVRLPIGPSKRYLGIYRLDGEELLFCMAAAGKERPAAFTAQPGSGQALARFRRERCFCQP
jgi:uncharacterized protein (TIGR03067 family)